jgi:hypothetical protein
VISKEEAGEWARSRFDPSWHALIEEALAYRFRQPDRLGLGVRERATLTARFVAQVVERGLAIL